MPYPKNRAGTLKLFGGSSHPEMTKLIARKVGARVGEVVLGKFENKETKVELKECVRGQDIYVVQTAGGKNPNDNLMELLFLVNALRLASASNIVVITPFFFYSKGDQKDGYRVPITSKLVGSLLKKAGATHLMMLDPHTPQLEGFFDLIIDTLRIEPLFCEWVRHHITDWENCIVVSPDEGGAKRSVSLANDLVLDFAIISNRNKKFEKESNQLCIHKRRKKKRSFCDNESVHTHKDSSRSSVIDPNEFADMRISPKISEIHNGPVIDINQIGDTLVLPDPIEILEPAGLEPEAAPDCIITKGTQTFISDLLVGHIDVEKPKKQSKPVGHLSSSVESRNVIIIDDMIDTGQTIELAIETCRRGGAISVTILVTHGVFSKSALKILESYGDFIKAVVVTNSISQTKNIENGRLKNKLHVLDVSGLIAEFVRRHHYCESVSVLGRFMPIRDSDFGTKRVVKDERKKKISGEAASSTEQEEIPSHENSPDDSAFKSEEVDDDNDSQSDLEVSVGPEDVEVARRQILDKNAQQKLRKGFRMASICWDD